MRDYNAEWLALTHEEQVMLVRIAKSDCINYPHDEAEKDIAWRLRNNDLIVFDADQYQMYLTWNGFRVIPPALVEIKFAT